MHLAPLLNAPLETQLHTLAGISALVIGVAQMSLRKGGALHRWCGYVWVALMAVLAISSFWLTGFRIIGPFSPIHLLSAITLFWLMRGVMFARARNIEMHRAVMHKLFWYALLGAFALTLLPGRLVHEVVFGP